MNAMFGARMGASMRVAALALAAFAVLTTTADAQVVRNDQQIVVLGQTVTFSTPITRSDCTPSGMTDSVYTLGVLPGWRVVGQINVGYMGVVSGVNTFIITETIPVDQLGNVVIPINYPPHSAITPNIEGVLEYHVEPQLEIVVNGVFVATLGPGQDWDVFCRDTPPPPPPPPGPQTGCTPGYWKVDQHFDSWPAPITPQTSFEGVFGSIPGDDVSFLTALQGGGGPGIAGALTILRRAAAASYLNALMPDGTLNFGYTPEQVVAYLNQVANSGNRDLILGIAGFLDGLNNRNCPLN